MHGDFSFGRHKFYISLAVIDRHVKDLIKLGKKFSQRVYKRYSGYPGGLTEIPFEKMRDTFPERIISEAVRRMLPKNRMQDKMMKRLRVVKGSEHPHAAQKPIKIDLK